MEVSIKSFWSKVHPKKSPTSVNECTTSYMTFSGVVEMKWRKALVVGGSGGNIHIPHSSFLTYDSLYCEIIETTPIHETPSTLG
jgi:hypothetical protein